MDWVGVPVLGLPAANPVCIHTGVVPQADGSTVRWQAHAESGPPEGVLSNAKPGDRPFGRFPRPITRRLCNETKTRLTAEAIRWKADVPTRMRRQIQRALGLMASTSQGGKDIYFDAAPQHPVAARLLGPLRRQIGQCIGRSMPPRWRPRQWPRRHPAQRRRDLHDHGRAPPRRGAGDGGALRRRAGGGRRERRRAGRPRRRRPRRDRGPDARRRPRDLLRMHRT